jgi:hypothetical protein
MTFGPKMTTLNVRPLKNCELSALFRGRRAEVTGTTSFAARPLHGKTPALEVACLRARAISMHHDDNPPMTISRTQLVDASFMRLFAAVLSRRLATPG